MYILYTDTQNNFFQISKLENGVRVASIDNGGNVTRLAIALQSGSRYESVAQQGISQLVKNAAFVVSFFQVTVFNDIIFCIDKIK